MLRVCFIIQSYLFFPNKHQIRVAFVVIGAQCVYAWLTLTLTRPTQSKKSKKKIEMLVAALTGLVLAALLPGLGVRPATQPVRHESAWWEGVSICSLHSECEPPERCDCAILGVRYCCVWPGLPDPFRSRNQTWPIPAPLLLPV